MRVNFGRLVYTVMVAIVFAMMAGCGKEEPVQHPDDAGQLARQEEQRKRDQEREDSLRKARERIQFSALVFPKDKKDSVMAFFRKEYDADEQYIILALNRLDQKNSWRADTLAIPQKIEKDFLKYAPFPRQLDSLKPVKKMAFFSYAIHAYALYENGTLVKWGPSSMGKKGTPTKTGLMFTNWKKELAISTSNSEWKLRWNFNIHNTAGIGWHQYDLPGFHASHSCLRLLEEDAFWMYNWADQWVLSGGGQKLDAKGTPVIVFGESDFKSKPWLQLLHDPAANDISIEEMNSIFVPYLDEILKEQKNSEEVRSKREAARAVASSADKSS